MLCYHWDSDVLLKSFVARHSIHMQALRCCVIYKNESCLETIIPQSYILVAVQFFRLRAFFTI